MKIMSKYIPLTQNKVTSDINKHMAHAEDLVLLGGENGLGWVVSMFKQLHEKLKGNTEEDKIKLSVKFDGSPSVFVWSEFPGLGYNGVAIKALFAKEPKLMYCGDDVDQYYGTQPELANKLKLMLKYIPQLNFPKGEIWQGDFLFDNTTLRGMDMEWEFQPNTIVYKINKASELGGKISESTIGIVWHTRYTGDSLVNVKAKYNTKVEELSNVYGVFMTDPYIYSIAGKVTLTEYENQEIAEKLKLIETSAKFLYNLKNEYDQIIHNPEFLAWFTLFQNSLIRKNKNIETSEDFIEEFVYFVSDRINKQIEIKISDKGKISWRKRLEVILNIIKNNNSLHIIIETMQLVTSLKLLFIKKLNNINTFETYLLSKDNRYIHIGDEGFAVSDMYGNVVKLVDRHEFSFANFSPEITKGWSM